MGLWKSTTVKAKVTAECNLSCIYNHRWQVVLHNFWSNSEFVGGDHAKSHVFHISLCYPHEVDMLPTSYDASDAQTPSPFFFSCSSNLYLVDPLRT